MTEDLEESTLIVNCSVCDSMSNLDHQTYLEMGFQTCPYCGSKETDVVDSDAFDGQF